MRADEAGSSGNEISHRPTIQAGLVRLSWVDRRLEVTETTFALAAGAFVLALITTFSLTPATGHVARRFGILDHPDEDPHGRKNHQKVTPYLGGVAITAGVVMGAAILALLAGERLELETFAGGLGLAVGLAAMGVLDDIRPLPRTVKLVGQLVVAGGAWSLGFRVLAFDSDLLNLVVTAIWIIGITNAFNLLDNMDGLTAGLAGIGGLSFAVMGLLGDLTLVSLMGAAVSGAALGFLVHNHHPAKVFMGDAGSLFLGFLLALIGIEVEFDALPQVTFLVPVVVLGLPIFDTCLVVASRLRHGRSPFQGYRDHVSHRLVAIGLPVRVAVALLYWAGLCLGWLGLVVSRSNVQVGWMLLGFVIALGAFFGAVLWRVQVYPSATTSARGSEIANSEGTLVG